MLSRFLHCLLCSMCVIACLPLLVGCTGTQNEGPKSTLGPPAEQAMNELKEMLVHLDGKNQPMPRNQQDLSAIGPVFPAAEVFVLNGSIVYAWGSKISTDSANADTVIAYESKADKDGGIVLMQDGTIKTMTPDEFNSAKVAGKKK